MKFTLGPPELFELRVEVIFVPPSPRKLKVGVAEYTSTIDVGVVVPIPTLPLASSVIACVKVIALPAVPEGAVKNLCSPLACVYCEANLDVLYM